MKCSCKYQRSVLSNPIHHSEKIFLFGHCSHWSLWGLSTLLELGRSSTSFYLLACTPMDNSEPCFLEKNQVSYFSQWKLVWSSTTDMLMKFWNITYSHLGIQSLPSQFTAIYIYIYIYMYIYIHTHTHTYIGLTLQLAGSQFLDQGLNLYPW